MVHCEDGRISSNIVIFLLLTLFTGAQSQAFGPRQVVIATVGDDVVLPCQLDPPQDAVSMTIEWGRPDLTPRFIYVWHDGRELVENQNEAFKGRTSLSTNMMNQGDVSLRLSTVKISDTGKYRCYFPKPDEELFVDLLVGSASSPLITLAGIHEATGGLELQCRSESWYPEPELLWLDSEGDLLPAGPPETLRGPDDLYTVSSRVTVEKRSNSSSSITCRVQQKETNQTRDTHFLISEEFFKPTCTTCAASIAVSCVLGLLLAGLSAGLLIWKRKQKETEIQTTTITQQQPLMEKPLKERKRVKEELLAERKRVKEELLAERKRAEEELEKKDEELKDLTLGVDALTKTMKDLKEQKQKVREQINKMEELMEKNEEKVTSLEEEGTEKKGENKSLGHIRLKTMMSETNWSLGERKAEEQKLEENLDNLLVNTQDEVKRILEKKKKVEKQKDEMKKHQEEIQRRLESP